MKHYVIGDVHGHYNTLLALVEKLPKDAKLIFVGDLIDRGPHSVEVVKFVRESGHLCVMGNHEEAMITQGFVLMRSFETGEDLPTHSMWYSNGGVWTLRSYGLVKLENGKPVKADNFTEGLKQFKEDMKWMEKLPLFIELEVEHISGLPVVVSHAPVATVWGLRYVESMYKTFRDMALSNRRDPDEDSKIFNIFGHTPVKFGVEIQPHHVNVDTGCYIGRNGYSRLSAYCVETGEAVSVEYMG
jgi:serine/threonine protein phosphatase 1